MKALYNYRTNRSKGNNIIVDVLRLEEDSSEIRYLSCRKWVSTKKLKPYLDPDSDGTEWLFLGYKISEQSMIGLLKYGIYKSEGEADEWAGHTSSFQEAKRIIINKLLEEGRQIT